MKNILTKKLYPISGLLLCSLFLWGCSKAPASVDIPPDLTPELTQEVSADTSPTNVPAKAPDVTPTEVPDATPTDAPDASPTEVPDTSPTEVPDVTPTDAPGTTSTPVPTKVPATLTPKPGDTHADSLQITIDETGLASWKPVRDAVSYEYDIFWYENDVLVGSGGVKSTTDTFLQLTHGQFLEIYPVYKNGQTGQRVQSETYIVEGMTQISYPENLVAGSLVSKNGTLSFSLQASDSRTIRVIGNKCKVEADGTILIEPGGKLFTADEVGKIFRFSTDLNSNTEFTYYLGYTFEEATEIVAWDAETSSFGRWGGAISQTVSKIAPNYLCYSPKESEQAVSISGFSIEYSPGSTGLKSLSLDSGFFPELLPGDPYNEALESSWDPENQVLDFYLLAVPDAPANSTKDTEIIYGTYDYTTGNLKDAKGNIVNKDDPLPEGATLEVTIGDYTYDVPVVQKQYTGAKTFHELLPSVYPEASGDLNVLVVPICWADQKDRATTSNMNFLKNMLGTVLDANGKVTEYSVDDDGKFSLSEYYNISSYEKLNIRSFVTDWYYSTDSYANVRDNTLTQEETTRITEWVRKTYPTLDWSLYDKDGNGLIDLVMFINTGDSTGYDYYSPLSNGGAFARFYSYTGEFAGTKQAPTVNNHLSTNLGMLYKSQVIGTASDYFPNVLIHEFAHCLGLIDYYDVSYSGIDAVGGYDMQSSNYGDWNVYSKYGAGWLNPTVITEASFGGKNSIDITIQSSALNNSALVIPAAGTSFDGSPFNEYIMVDLFTPEGVHEKDAAQYKLQDTVGVRIYHVHGQQVKRTLTGSDGKTYTIGTIQIGNNYAYMAKNYGFYHLELIQADGNNTFTDTTKLNPTVSDDDFFKAGDTFTAESYDQFLYNGKMDNGKEFGYSIQIISVSKDAATIRITKK